MHFINEHVHVEHSRVCGVCGSAISQGHCPPECLPRPGADSAGTNTALFPRGTSGAGWAPFSAAQACWLAPVCLGAEGGRGTGQTSPAAQVRTYFRSPGRAQPGFQRRSIECGQPVLRPVLVVWPLCQADSDWLERETALCPHSPSGPAQALPSSHPWPWPHVVIHTSELGCQQLTCAPASTWVPSVGTWQAQSLPQGPCVCFPCLVSQPRAHGQIGWLIPSSILIFPPVPFVSHMN